MKSLPPLARMRVDAKLDKVGDLADRLDREFREIMAILRNGHVVLPPLRWGDGSRTGNASDAGNSTDGDTGNGNSSGWNNADDGSAGNNDNDDDSNADDNND